MILLLEKVINAPLVRRPSRHSKDHGQNQIKLGLQADVKVTTSPVISASEQHLKEE